MDLTRKPSLHREHGGIRYMRRIVLNQFFSSQKITGQQRYATELSAAIHRLRPARNIEIPAVYRGKRSAEWLWSVSRVHRLAADEYLLSFTSRAPVRQKRHILTVHDLFVLSNPEWFSKAYVRTHAPLLKAQLASCVGCIAVSQPTLESLDDFLPAKTPRVLAPNGIAPIFATDSEPESNVQEILDRFELQPQKYLLTVGSQDPRKNFSRLVAAYTLLPVELRMEFPLVIVGGNNKSFATLDRQTTSQVRQVGYVDDRELSVMYRQAKGVVFPSLAEGFGLPVVEAAANVAPLALSDLPVFRWIYGLGAHYFDPLDIFDICGALEELVGASAPTEMLKAKREYVFERFSWDGSAQAVIDLVDSL